MFLAYLFFAATTNTCNKGSLFSSILPHWWEFLNVQPDPTTLGQCSVVNFKFPTDLLAVGLGVLDIALRLVGFIAVVVIIISGINHMFTEGSPEKAATARKWLFNGIIGVAIALFASIIVTFIGKQLT